MKLIVQLALRAISVCAVLESSIAASAGSLYECHNESGKSLYTDSPAQLDQCKPVQFGQPHNVANPASGNSATQPEVQPPASVAGDTSPASQAANSDSIAVSGPPSTTAGCPAGLNPLNPFSTPGCQQ